MVEGNYMVKFFLFITASLGELQNLSYHACPNYVCLLRAFLLGVTRLCLLPFLLLLMHFFYPSF
jgi:hypothetical protein